MACCPLCAPSSCGRGGLHVSARADAPDAIHTGEPGKYPPEGSGRAEVRFSVRNSGDTELAAGVRGLLLPGFEAPDQGDAALPELRVPPGGVGEASFVVAVQPSFSRDALRYVSYPSVPLTAEVCWDGGSVLLSAAARIC
jgi:hypothetical protein